jgi:hypothetical protein
MEESQPQVLVMKVSVARLRSVQWIARSHLGSVRESALTLAVRRGSSRKHGRSQRKVRMEARPAQKISNAKFHAISSLALWTVCCPNGMTMVCVRLLAERVVCSRSETLIRRHLTTVRCVMHR